MDEPQVVLVESGETARRWRTEVRVGMGLILLAVCLLAVNAWQAERITHLLIDRFDQQDRDRAAAKDDVLRHVVAANACERDQDPDVQACVDRMLPPPTTRPAGR